MSLLEYACMQGVPVEVRRGRKDFQQLEVAGDCKLSGMVLESEFGDSARALCSLNC